jgi:hypothetical protein
MADFNGDGFADLAVGVPDEDGAPNGKGGVNVIYGSASGLIEAGDQFWSQDSPGIKEVAEPGDRFGHSLAVADFNGDGFADLAVGVPGEDFTAGDEGGVNVIYGSASGLTEAGDQFWSQDSPGIKEVAEEGDTFGNSLAAADFGKGTGADLAVGVPGESFAVHEGGGANVIYGSASGLTATGNQFWSQDSPGVEGVAGSNDLFGSSLAAADFGKGPRADLAVGVPGEDVAADLAGGVNIIYGSGSGLSEAGNQFWSQDSPGIEGVAGSVDEFGFSLAAADFGKGSRADLAVGVPGERTAGDFAGGVNIIYGSGSGLTDAGNQFWSQDSPGIKGVAEEGKLFGFALSASRT